MTTSLGPAAVIVTGAGSGIGKATVDTILASGRDVVGVDRTESAGENTGEGCGRYLAVVADVADPGQVEAAWKASFARFGRVDGLVNCAGISAEDGKLEHLALDVFDRVHAVNLRGTLLMCQQAIEAFRACGGGAMVNIGSVAGLRGLGGVAYAVSKAGVTGLTKAISQQYAPEFIRCNTVCPGMVDTPLLERARQKGMTPTSRPGVIPGVGRPGDVAALIAFLLSDNARNISGAVYTMDGGLTVH